MRQSLDLLLLLPNVDANIVLFHPSLTNITRIWRLMSIKKKFEPLHVKTNNVVVCPAKTQISLVIHPVWSESSLSARRGTGSLAVHWAHSEDSDQTGRMPRLIWVLAGRTVIVCVLSRGGSFTFNSTKPISCSFNVKLNRVLRYTCIRRRIVLVVAKDDPLDDNQLVERVKRGKKENCRKSYRVDFSVHSATFRYAYIVQLGHGVGGNFNIPIWACSGCFIVRNRRTGNNVTVPLRMHTKQPRDKKPECMAKFTFYTS